MAITFSSLPTPTATEGLSYSSNFVATGGTGPYTYAIIGGALPQGLALNSSTGAVTGIPTASAGFTYVVQATDSLTATGTAFGLITVSGGSAPPNVNPVAVHTYDFVHNYVSTRTGGAPGTGGWTTPTIIYDGTFSGPANVGLQPWPNSPGFASTVSAGALTGNLSEPRGIITTAFNGSQYLGDGLPTVPIDLVYPGPQTPGVVDYSFNFWDAYQGASTQGGVQYVAVIPPSGDSALSLYVLKSTDGFTTPVNSDSAHAPTGPYSGEYLAMQRIDNYFYFFICTDNNLFLSWVIQPFNLTTGLWEASFAPLTVNLSSGPRFAPFAWSNGIFKFSNGDFLILYNRGGSPLARLWVQATTTWGSEQTLPGAQLANALMDPSLGKVWIFTYTSSFDSPQDSSVHVSSFTHSGSVITPDIFIIPASSGSGASDGVGHPSIQNGLMFVPRDDREDGAFSNAIWVGTLPGLADFTREWLPRPTAETNQINTFQLTSGHHGTGYAHFDTFTLPGDYPAQGRVTVVSGGVPSSVAIDYHGGNITVANGVPATPDGPQPGVGTGLEIDILAVVPKTPSCSYMMWPNGYTLAAPPPLTLTCPVGGGTATVGVAYTATLVASGGATPYSFAIIAGSLPPGLSLNTSTGVISGTPTFEGSYTYTAQVTDANSNTATATCTISVGPGGGGGSGAAAHSLCVLNSGGGGTFQDTPYIVRRYSFNHERMPADVAFFTPWTDFGYQFQKTARNLLLDIDTAGVACSILLQTDGGGVQTFSVTTTSHDRDRVLSTNSDLEGKLWRLSLTPGTGGKAQLFSAGLDFVPDANILTLADTYEQNLGYVGWKALKQVWVQYKGGPLTMNFLVDGGLSFYSITFPYHAVRDMERHYFPAVNSGVLNKSKKYRIQMSGTSGFRLYADSILEFIQFGSDQRGSFQLVGINPEMQLPVAQPTVGKWMIVQQ